MKEQNRRSLKRTNAGGASNGAAGNAGGAGRQQQLGSCDGGSDEGDGDVKSELERRSKYHSAVRRDVEVHSEMIGGLGTSIRTFNSLGSADGAVAASKLEACLRETDEKLAILVDEHAVLKSFDTFPEAKLDAMRETHALWKEMTRIKDDLVAWKTVAETFGAKLDDDDGGGDDDVKEEVDASQHATDAISGARGPSQRGASKRESHKQKLEGLSSICSRATKILDVVQPRLDDTHRLRESRAKKLRQFQIGFDEQRVTDARHATVHVANALLGAALIDISSADAQRHGALRLAYRVYQLAGGFDESTAALFERLTERLVADAQAEEHHHATAHAPH